MELELRRRTKETTGESQEFDISEDEDSSVIIEDTNPEIINPSSSNKGADKEEEKASAFECNICFDDPSQPVLSKCGHLYCWPCIYKVDKFILVFFQFQIC